jgi:pheophorbide a oxygenase
MLGSYSPNTTTNRLHRRTPACAQHFLHHATFHHRVTRPLHAVAGRQASLAAEHQQDSYAAADSHPHSATPAAEAAPQQQQHAKEQFDWYKAWYPVAILDDLDPAVPCQVRLLGMDIAVWWDRAAGQWR